MATSAWGTEETKFFFALTPDQILTAVEKTGVQTTGRCLQLNSMENRVYEIELELDNDNAPLNERFCVAKFYRPGRWTKEQILEEHQFLLDLKEYELPVVPPKPFPSGETLATLEDLNIYYTLFPKCGGRIPDELDTEQLLHLGRLLARLHNVGNIREAKHRIHLTPETYGLQSLEFLLSSDKLPVNIQKTYEATVREICETISPWLETATVQRIHGDCHLGNILWRTDGPYLVDFDDMVIGPPVQDLWLLIPGRDQYAKKQLSLLLEGYEVMRPFPLETLRLIEPLRALRMIHFSAWIAKRFEDPAFKRVFVEFGSDKYWNEQLQALLEIKSLILTPS